ncbi:DNA primase [Lachnospiraceae bacterium HCP1S3_C3]|nr:DNA primase [Lachnospiraceae bacterium]
MRYPEELIEEIRQRNDIVDVISGYVKLQKKGSSYFGLCPFHNEKSPSFSVSPGKQMYYCFGCGEGGNVFTFLMRYENDTFQEAVKALADKAGVKLPELEYSEEEKKNNEIKSTILRANKDAAMYFYHQLRSEQGAQGYGYFKSRGLRDETIVKFGLGYSPKYSDSLYRYLKHKGYLDDVLKETGLFKYREQGVYDAFWNRVMYPIMDNGNRVIGFGGRVLGDEKPKYINSPETRVFDKSRNLYGLNFARISRRKNFILCEGYMDVIALHQAGFDNAVAALGTAFTHQHAALIKRYTENVLVTFDSDGAGVKAALRAIPILRNAGIAVRVINMRPYKDPDEFIKNLGNDEFEKRIQDAENAFIYEIRMMQSDYEIRNPDERARFYEKVAEKLLTFNDEVERNIYIETVCDEFMIPKDTMNKLVYRQSLVYTGEKENTGEQLPKKQNNAERAEDGMKRSQRILLTWLIEDTDIYGKIKELISEEDFIDGFYKKVAKMLFEQLEEGNVNPARILNSFESEDEQKEAAALFHATLGEKMTAQEKEKAFNETIRRVKKNSLEYASRNATDVATLQKIIREQAKMQNMYISLS